MKKSGMLTIINNIYTSLKPLTKTPIANIIKNSYTFFYNFPKRNLLYDRPPILFQNLSSDYLAYYQIPHNLPPYQYYEIRGELPKDFFCFGLPGNTLPMGNFDPWFLSQVTKSVVRKYRESELKHGRLAMLGTCGFVIQENYHPFYPMIGGLSATHMDQLNHLSFQDGILGKILINFDVKISDQSFGLDYYILILFLSSIEIFAIYRNWTRWSRNEYDHPFVGNIGIGNLKDDYQNGNYGFDPLNFMPDDEVDQIDLKERELNNGRLAMIAFTGMILQEYLTGQPVLISLTTWLDNFDLQSSLSVFESVGKIPSYIIQQYSSGDFPSTQSKVF